MNWGAIGSGGGTLLGAGLGYALAPATGGLSIPASMALGGSLGGAAGGLTGNLMQLQGMPPVPQTQLPKMNQFGGKPSIAESLQGPPAGQKGYLRHPFVQG